MLKGSKVPANVAATIVLADAILRQFAGKLPYGTPNSTMVALAGILDTYNNGGYGVGHCR